MVLKMLNCLLAGVGGQGTILASKLIAQTAINKGLNARTAETIGMAQRGGSVVSHVRIGDTIFSPMIPLHSADILIGFEPSEAIRCLDFLKDDGIIITNKKSIKPVTSSLSNNNYDENETLNYLKNSKEKLLIIDGEKICNKIGSQKVLNVVLLGAAIQTGILGINIDEMKNTIYKKIPKKYLDININALEHGAYYCLNNL